MSRCASKPKMQKIIIKAPAKVNTLLRVIGKREDGYHDLQMVMVPLTLADEIELRNVPEGVSFEMDGQTDSGMVGEGNLVVKAARAMITEAGPGHGVSIRLTKKVPVAAGLGGGSSDAAAVLKGLNLLWNLNWTPERLASIGKKLGADVPFFCFDGPAFVEGIGDRITPYETFPDIHFLLVNPGFSVSTPWVYKQFDLGLTLKTPDARVRPLFQVFSDVSASLHNDLEAVTIKAFPEIQTIKNMLVDLGAAGSLMSGSGPTVYGVFGDAKKRDAAFALIRGKNWRVFSADLFWGRSVL